MCCVLVKFPSDPPQISRFSQAPCVEISNPWGYAVGDFSGIFLGIREAAIKLCRQSLMYCVVVPFLSVPPQISSLCKLLSELMDKRECWVLRKLSSFCCLLIAVFSLYAVQYSLPSTSLHVCRKSVSSVIHASS